MGKYDHLPAWQRGAIFVLWYEAYSLLSTLFRLREWAGVGGVVF